MKRGKTHKWAAAALGIASCCGAMSWGPPSVSQSPPEQVLKELNLAIDNSVLMGWQCVPREQAEQSGFSKNTICFNRAVPFIQLTFKAANVANDGVSDKAKLKAWVDNFKRTASGFDIQKSESVKAAGMEGHQLTVEYKSALGKPMTLRMWAGIQNGRMYELRMSSEKPFGTIALSDWQKVLSGLRLIDSRRKFSVNDAEELRIRASMSFGYGVVLPAGTGWREWETIKTDIVGFDLGLVNQKGSRVAVAVMPLNNQRLDSQQLFDAMLTMTTIKPESFTKKEVLNDLQIPGIVAAGEADFDGKTRQIRARVMQIHGYGILCLGMAAAETDIQKVEAALTCFNFNPIRKLGVRSDRGPTSLVSPGERAFNPNDLLPQQRMQLGLTLNALGLEKLKARDLTVAVNLFRAAFELSLDPTVAENLSLTLAETGEPREALLIAEKLVTTFPRDERFLKWALVLAKRTGDLARAEELARSCCILRPTDPAAHTAWVNILIDRDELNKAVNIAKAFAVVTKTEQANALLANTLLAAKRHEEVIKLFETRTPSATMAVPLARAYYKAQRHEDLLRLLDKVRETDSDADAWILRGMALLALNRGLEAKESFDKAMMLRPGDPEIQEMAKSVGGSVGQGSNAAIRTPLEPVQVPPELLAAATEISGLDQSLGAVYLNRLTAMEFKPNSKLKTTEYIRIRILDQRGVEAFTSMRFAINPLRERVFVNSVQVYDDKDTKLAEGRPESFYILDMPTDEIATLEQQLTVPVPSLRPGCEIRITFTREMLSTSEQIEFTDHYMSSRFPIARSLLFFRGSLDQVRIREGAGVSRREITGRDGGTLWETVNPVLLRMEERLPFPKDYLPYVTLYPKNATWEEEGRTYLEMIKERLIIPASVKETAARLTADKNSIEEKVQALGEYVQSQLTYKAVAFGRAARVPNPVETIMSNRFGDCKDHSLLLYQLLNAAEIKAQLALVNYSTPVVDEVVSTDQFDHMIVYVPEMKEDRRWLDMTAKYGDVMMPPPVYGKLWKALVLGEKSKLIQIDGGETMPPGYDIERKVKVTDRGEVKVVERIEVSKRGSGLFRSFVLGIEEKSRAERVTRGLFGDTVEYRNAEVSFDHLEDKLEPVSVQLKYDLKQRLRAVGGRMVGDVPSLFEKYNLHESSNDSREIPFQIASPFYLNVKVSFELPAGWQIEGWEEQKDIDSAYQSSTIRRTVTADGHYQAELRMKRKMGLFKAKDYKDFIESMTDLVDNWAVPLMIRKDN